jgi:hypothetical protein
MFFVRSSAIAVFLLFSVPSLGATLLADDVKAINKIDRDVIDPKEKVPQLRRQYERISNLVAHVGLEKLDDDDVSDFYEASFKLAFYTLEPADVRKMRGAFQELEARRLATARNREDMLTTYVAARMFEEALAFRKLPENDALSQTPEFEDETDGARHSSPTLLRVSKEGLFVTRHAHPIGDGVQVIVVSSPSCHFSREAVEAISKDRELSAKMARASTWIVPQENVENFSSIAKWAEKYPNAHMEPVFRQSEWTFVPNWQTPGFYFLKDGKLVDSVVGWPNDQQIKKLSAAFHQVGM